MARVNITVKVKNSLRIDSSIVKIWGVIVAPVGYESRVVEVQTRIPMHVDMGMDQYWNAQVAPEDSLILFPLAEETALLSEEGNPIWRSETAENFGTGPGRSVAHGFCRVGVIRGDGSRGKPRAHVDILQTGDARLLHTVDDFWNFYAEFMDASIGGVENNANSVVRIISKETGEMITMWLYCARQPVTLPPLRPGLPDRTFTLPASAKRTWEEAIVRGEQAKGLARVVAAALGEEVHGMSPEHAKLAGNLRLDLDASKLMIEAIPGQRIRVVGYSLDRLLNAPESRVARAAEQCVIRRPADREPVLGFVEMTVGLMASPPKGGENQPDTIIVTNFVPADRDMVARGVDKLATPNYTPVIKNT